MKNFSSLEFKDKTFDFEIVFFSTCLRNVGILTIARKTV